MSRTITIEEAAQHNKKGDLWVIIHGKVYDVSNWMRDHPGGEEILLVNSKGKDATYEFEQVKHGGEARKLANKYKIGVVPGGTDGDMPAAPSELNTFNPNNNFNKKAIGDDDSTGTIVALAAAGAAVVAAYLYWKSKSA